MNQHSIIPTQNINAEQHTNHDQPFRLLDTVLILLRIPQCLNLHVLGFLDLVGGAVADEDGLASPFDDDLFPSVYRLHRTRSDAYVLALWNGRQVDLDLSHSQNIRGSRHVHKEICVQTQYQQSI